MLGSKAGVHSSVSGEKVELVWLLVLCHSECSRWLGSGPLCWVSADSLALKNESPWVMGGGKALTIVCAAW